MKSFIAPAITFFVSVVSVVALVLGTIADPAGAINTFFIKAIDIVLLPFPSTPNNLKLANLLASFATSVPVVGWGILSDILVVLFSFLSIYLLVKLYKLIPFI